MGRRGKASADQSERRKVEREGRVVKKRCDLVIHRLEGRTGPKENPKFFSRGKEQLARSAIACISKGSKRSSVSRTVKSVIAAQFLITFFVSLSRFGSSSQWEVPWHIPRVKESSEPRVYPFFDRIPPRRFHLVACPTSRMMTFFKLGDRVATIFAIDLALDFDTAYCPSVPSYRTRMPYRHGDVTNLRSYPLIRPVWKALSQKWLI